MQSQYTPTERRTGRLAWCGLATAAGLALALLASGAAAQFTGCLLVAAAGLALAKGGRRA